MQEAAFMLLLSSLGQQPVDIPNTLPPHNTLNQHTFSKDKDGIWNHTHDGLSYIDKLNNLLNLSSVPSKSWVNENDEFYFDVDGCHGCLRLGGEVVYPEKLKRDKYEENTDDQELTINSSKVNDTIKIENSESEKIIDQYDPDTNLSNCDGCLEIGKEVVDPGGLQNGDDYFKDTTVDGCSQCLEIGKEIRNPGGLADGDQNTQLDDVGASSDIEMKGYRIIGTSNIYGSRQDYTLNLRGPGEVKVFADDKSSGISFFVNGQKECWIVAEGLSCKEPKNWVHKINQTHVSYYTSQESARVRAVYEGKVSVVDGKVNVSLPNHFSSTVSDKNPLIRVQATPRSLVTVAVTERSDDWIVIEANTQEEVLVDYRVTGIREGYENRNIVRSLKR